MLHESEYIDNVVCLYFRVCKKVSKLFLYIDYEKTQKLLDQRKMS